MARHNRYLTPDDIADLKRRMSDTPIRVLSRETGIDREVLRKVRRGTHRPRAIRGHVEPWRCPTCRGRVLTPKCILCEVRGVA